MTTDTANGGQFYDDPDVLASYLDHRHAPTRSPNIAMEEPAFLAAMGDVTGQRVLDLGCGDAAFADTVIQRGARSYVGVDGSAAMIAEARRRNSERVSVVHESIENYEPEADAFDLVASRMAMHYVADLDPALKRARQALRPGGRLIITVVHPVITSAGRAVEGQRSDCTVDRYFERGPRQRHWFGSTVTWHHRTVAGYVGAVQRGGLEFVSMSECEPDGSILADHPAELERRRRVPVMLLLHARQRASW